MAATATQMHPKIIMLIGFQASSKSTTAKHQSRVSVANQKREWRWNLNPRDCVMVGDQKTDESMATRLSIKCYDVAHFWE